MFCIRKARAGTAAALLLMVGLAGCHSEGDGSVAVTMQCDTADGSGTQTVQSVFAADAESVTMTIGDQAARTLTLADTTQGAQFVDGDFMFWSNAPGTGFIAEGDEIKLANCQVVEQEQEEKGLAALFGSH